MTSKHIVAKDYPYRQLNLTRKSKSITHAQLK